MLKSKKFRLAVILIVVTNIGTAVGCMFLAKKITAMHIFSVYSNLNLKKIEAKQLTTDQDFLYSQEFSQV